MQVLRLSESAEALRGATGGPLLERQQRLEVCVHLFDQYITSCVHLLDKCKTLRSFILPVWRFASIYSTNMTESGEALRDAKGGALLERQQRLEVCVHLFKRFDGLRRSMRPR